MPTDKSIVTEIGTVKAHVRPVIKEVCSVVPDDIYFVYGYSPVGSGEHPKGLALDFGIKDYGKGEDNPGTERRALGDFIANYLVKNYKRLNIWYIIWNRREWSNNPDNEAAYHKWGKYTGSNPHTDHVHVSFYANRSYTPPKGTEMESKDVWEYEVSPGETSKAIALHYKLAPKYAMVTMLLGTFVRILRLEQLEQARYTALKKDNEAIKKSLIELKGLLAQRQGVDNGAQKVPE